MNREFNKQSWVAGMPVAGAEKPQERVSQVRQAMTALEEAIQSLACQMETLGKRIEPVLACVPADISESKTPQEFNTPLASQIDAKAHQILQLRDRLAGWNSILEL